MSRGFLSLQLIMTILVCHMDSNQLACASIELIDIVLRISICVE
jgi:hypothetical protein